MIKHIRIVKITCFSATCGFSGIFLLTQNPTANCLKVKTTLKLILMRMIVNRKELSIFLASAR